MRSHRRKVSDSRWWLRLPTPAHVACVLPLNGIFACHREHRGLSEHVACLLDVEVARKTERTAQEPHVKTDVGLSGSFPLDVGITTRCKHYTCHSGSACAIEVVGGIALVVGIHAVGGIVANLRVTILSPCQT